jgi:predicted nucleotidyltransferase
MRHPSGPASILHKPLDEILGSRGNVGVLRVLCRHGGPLPTRSVADRSRLTRQGIKKALDQLVALGIVEPVGQGRSLLYELNEEHPLATAITGLFRAETARVDALFDLIRRTAESLRPPPLAIWLYGSAARREDHAGSDLDLAVVGDSREIAEQSAALEDALLQVSESWTIRPSIITLTPADVKRHARERTAFWKNLERDTIPIYGATLGRIADG